MPSRRAVVGACGWANQIEGSKLEGGEENEKRTFGSGLSMISPMKSFASSFLRTFATFGSAGPHMSYCPLCFTASDGSSRALPCPVSVGSIIALNGPFCLRFAIRRSRSFSFEVTTGLGRDVSGFENTAGTAERCERIRVEVRSFFVLSVCRTDGNRVLISKLEGPDFVHTFLITDSVYEEKLRVWFILQRPSAKAQIPVLFTVRSTDRTPVSVPLRVALLASLLPRRYRHSSSTLSCLFVKVGLAGTVHQQRRAGWGSQRPSCAILNHHFSPCAFWKFSLQSKAP
jgi:hypothetical protein